MSYYFLWINVQSSGYLKQRKAILKKKGNSKEDPIDPEELPSAPGPIDDIHEYILRQPLS